LSLIGLRGPVVPNVPDLPIPDNYLQTGKPYADSVSSKPTWYPPAHFYRSTTATTRKRFVVGKATGWSVGSSRWSCH
jgi:hypothetical protein